MTGRAHLAAVRGGAPDPTNRTGTLGAAMAEESAETDRPVGAVERALQVMEIIGNVGSAGVTEIALELGVHKSTGWAGIVLILAQHAGYSLAKQLE